MGINLLVSDLNPIPNRSKGAQRNVMSRAFKIISENFTEIVKNWLFASNKSFTNAPKSFQRNSIANEAAN